MQIVLTADEVRERIATAIATEFEIDVDEVVLHSGGGATAIVYVTAIEDIEVEVTE